MCKRGLLLVLGALLLTPMVEAQRTTRVRPHVRKSTGTYVEPHRRTVPNRTQGDNWSSKPNQNPDTGKKGTRTPKK